MAKKLLLKEVVIIRVLVILLLVVYHSFAPYCKVWAPIGSGAKIEIYHWIALISYSFMLEGFVFISGYLFGQQLKSSGVISLKQTVTSKFHRIIVPSLLFSFIYLLFLRYDDGPKLSWFWSITEGVGHLWFLPMLFWCFLLTILIEKIRINFKIALVLTLLMAVTLSGFKQLPFRIYQTFNYLMFFYAGYVLRRHDFNVEKFCSQKIIVSVAVGYAIFAVIGIYMKPLLTTVPFSWLILKIAKFCYAFLGVAFIFLLSYRLVYISKIRIAPWFIALSNICFGIYIFQEFILQIMYYKYRLLDSLPDLLIPWIGLILTLIISIILTVTLRKTRLGRQLLG